MTGCAPHLSHPVTLFMMLCSEPGIEDDFTNAFPFKIKESCLIYLNNMKGKETQDIEIGHGRRNPILQKNGSKIMVS